MGLLSIQFALYLLCLALPIGIGIRYFRRLDVGLRLIWGFLLLTFFCELSAGLLGIERHNNLIVYHIYTPLCLALFCAYHHYRLPLFRRYRLAYAIALAGVLMEVLDTLHFDPVTALDSDAILFSAACTLAMCLYGLSVCLVEEKRSMHKSPHTWVSLLFCIFWCCCGLLLGCPGIFRGTHGVAMIFVDYFWGVSMLIHLGIAYVFFSFKSLQASGHE